MQVTWDDGRVAQLPIPYLRSWCPCAECQGHSGVVRQMNVAPEMTLLDAWEIGSYAIGLRFSDRHDKGLFTWRWLAQLDPAYPPVGLKRGEFVDDAFRTATEDSP